MPGSMIHTQHSSSFPHYGLNLASPSDFSPHYSTNPSYSQAKNSPPTTPSSSSYTGFSFLPCKDETPHRYHIPANTHDAHQYTENYPPNSSKIQYDSHATTPALKHTINSDLDMPAVNGTFHPHPSFPIYNPNNHSTGNTMANNHSHIVNYSHSQAHDGGHASSFSTMTSFSATPMLNSSPPLHHQLATENTHSSTQATTDINGIDRRVWATHARGCTPQPAIASPPSSPTKSPTSTSSPVLANTSPSSSSSSSSSSEVRNTSPQPSSSSRPTSSRTNSTLPKLRTSLPSPSSPPSSPSSNTSTSPPASPCGTKRRRSEQERREKHNDTERKGRQKINSEIRVLKNLLPELQNSAAPKVSVLQCAVDTIKRRTEYANSMQQQNAHLRDENKALKAEVQRLQHLLGVSTSNQSTHHPIPSSHHAPSLQPLELDKRHDVYPFPGPLAPAPSVSLPSKQWY